MRGHRSAGHPLFSRQGLDDVFLRLPNQVGTPFTRTERVDDGGEVVVGRGQCGGSWKTPAIANDINKNGRHPERVWSENFQVTQAKPNDEVGLRNEARFRRRVLPVAGENAGSKAPAFIDDAFGRDGREHGDTERGERVSPWPASRQAAGNHNRPARLANGLECSCGCRRSARPARRDANDTGLRREVDMDGPGDLVPSYGREPRNGVRPFQPAVRLPQLVRKSWRDPRALCARDRGPEG